jgi:CSLREA domain-containing protein
MTDMAIHRAAWVERARTFAFCLLALLVAACLLLAAKPAHAATFTVNSTGDAGDQTPGNGSCDTGVRIPGGGVGLVPECTLRAAIEETNANDNNATVVDAIDFNIGGSGVKTIQPTSGLPDITEPVTINGYSQPGSKPNTLASGNNAVPKIELDGTNAGSTSGLGLATDGNVIRGLVINRFVAYGVGISTGSTENKIEGNFIGTDATGTRDLGNDLSGVTIFDAPNNTVGGTAPAARNVISGNENFGVAIQGDDNKVQGNYIGANRNGTADLGNTLDGVGIMGGASNTMGGATGARNTIAFNGSSGVTVFSGVRNRILSNSIHSNDALGIDLGGDGITPNDPGDPDTGPNNLQNFPVITSAKTGRRATTIKSTFDSTPSGTSIIHYFSNPKGTRDEGKNFIGWTAVTDTDGDGIITTFLFKSARKVKPGLFVTATATDDTTGDTSEFSAPRKVRG